MSFGTDGTVHTERGQFRLKRCFKYKHPLCVDGMRAQNGCASRASHLVFADLCNGANLQKLRTEQNEFNLIHELWQKAVCIDHSIGTPFYHVLCPPSMKLTSGFLAATCILFR